MKFILIVVACYYIVETGCLAQVISSVDTTPTGNSNPSNIETLQQQLQQLLDQEAQLKVMRQKLLQQLEKTEQHRKNENVGSGKVTYGLAPPSSQLGKSKTNPIPTTPQAPNTQFPFAEVYLESSGIVIVNPKVPNRRVITS